MGHIGSGLDTSKVKSKNLEQNIRNKYLFIKNWISGLYKILISFFCYPFELD